MSLAFKDLKPVQALAAGMFYKHRRLLLALPRQEGKTELGVRILHDITKRPWTSSSLFLAKDKKSGKKATREKFERIFDKRDFNVNTEFVSLKKHTTSAIFMDSVDKEPDRIRGGTYSMIHWSEVAFSKIVQGETIISVYNKVIKPTMSKTNGYCLLESTNNGRNGWYDLWENYRDFGFHRLKISLSDLVYMGLVTPEYYDAMQKDTLPDVFRQEYECEWVSFAGKIYEEFNHKRHIDPHMEGPKEWMMVVSAIDWGYDPSATCILYAYVKDGILHVFDEHYELKELGSVTAQRIIEKLGYWNIENHASVADHEGDRIEELNRRGIVCGQANKVNVLGARIGIKELFYFDQIKIHPRCKNLIRDLDSAVWHPKKEGDIDATQCTWGHFDAEAALRYLVRELSQMEREEPLVNPHASLDPVSAMAFDMYQMRQAMRSSAA